MCIFSEEVKYVANTRIFARRADDGHQMLAYQMRYTSRHPVAMILPLPVKRQAQDKTPAVRFISLKSYPTFFEDLNNAFPIPRSSGDAAGDDGGDEPMDVLPVYQVGDFVASFVPTIADFKRLNKRFTLPLQTWNKIPAYHDYGFAVFQLKAARAGKKAHPMALSFASRYSDRLFSQPSISTTDTSIPVKPLTTSYTGSPGPFTAFWGFSLPAHPAPKTPDMSARRMVRWGASWTRRAQEGLLPAVCLA